MDYMHSVCEGVVKSFATAMLSHSRPGVTLGPETRRLLDRTLRNIRLPHEFQRQPRGLGDAASMKAQEWRSFLLFSSALVFPGILAPELDCHWLFLSWAIHLLTGDCCTDMMIESARKLLGVWHDKISAAYAYTYTRPVHTYGTCYTYNAHSVLHLPVQAQYFGPLWTTSAFFYEGINHVLIKYVTGTTFTGRQIVSKVLRFQEVLRSDHPYQVGLLDPTSKIAGVSANLLRNSDSERVLIVSSKPLNLETLTDITSAPIPDDTVLTGICKRVIKNNVCYHSRHYNRSFRSCSHVCMISGTELIDIDVFVISNVNHVYALGRIFRKRSNMTELYDGCQMYRELENSVLDGECPFFVADEIGSSFVSCDSLGEKCVVRLLDTGSLYCAVVRFSQLFEQS